MIITAEQAHEKAEERRILKRAKAVEDTLDWCEWASDRIRSDAEKGLMDIRLSLPQSNISRCFTQEDLYALIKEIFISLGYEVEIHKSALYLAW